MQKKHEQHVFKYFPSGDKFVRIRVAENGVERMAENFGIGQESTEEPLNGADYRRAVVARFIDDLPPEAAQPDSYTNVDVEDLIDELYRLVVNVNPEFDLHGVKLPETPRVAPEPRKQDPATSFTRRLKRLAQTLEARLSQRIVGQRVAVEAVGRAVRRAALGWDARGPLGSLLFIGPTGTGKTELAKALAEELGDSAALIRIDCTEFAEGHEYAKLIGAPPGYIGHEDGGLLSQGLFRAPRAVLLFDEVEKAHPRVHDLLLQMLDEGHITDGRGVRLDLSSCFILLTSNTGTRELARAADSIGFAEGDLTTGARQEIVERALSERFRPEFLARLGETVVFQDLSAKDTIAIAGARLTELAASVRRGSRRRVRFSGAVARWVAETAKGQGEGARGIRHVIRRDVEAPLAELALGRASHRWIAVCVQRGRLRFAYEAD